MATTTRTIVGLFDTPEQARMAVSELNDAGVRSENISLLVSDRDKARAELSREMSSDATTMGETIVGGALLGGLSGLLIGLAALAIPGIGPVVAAGPLAATLAGVGLGAVGGGIIGAIRDAGVPDEEAQVYAEGVRRGGVLVAVRGTDISEAEIIYIMNRHRAVDIEQRGAEYRQSGWTGFDENAAPYQTEMSGKPLPGHREEQRNGARVYHR